MDVAGPETVLGDFNNAVFTHNGITSKFNRKDDRYLVYSEGADGKMAEFEIKYTFGISPLQQYLISFPGGRLQCLSIAWDVEQKKWYHLYPVNTPAPGDWMHWTRNAQNWNGMCAECHSTNLLKNFDPATNSYQTTWSEIDVSCEACHGPGSLHVKWAEIPDMARPNDKTFGLVVQTGNLDSKGMVELCAPCHSRRTIIGDYDHTQKEQLDTFLPELLNEGMYYADGQILEEVYVYASFLQSKMYRMGVSCSDCHDVHSLKFLKEGNDLCLQCHRADLYNTSAHHFHKPVFEKKPSKGWLCKSCHMPQRAYMGIDYRADHSIRIPRPDLNRAIHVPDACSMKGCHGDKPAQWSADACTKWYGISRRPHYGAVISAGREAKPEALPDLIRISEDRLYPPIVRATALTLLRSYGGENVRAALKRAVTDEEPLVRHTAVVNSGILSPENRGGCFGPLLWDPVRAVRIEAARALAEVPENLLKPDQRKKFGEVLSEYENAMMYSLDFPFAGFNLGNLYTALNQPEKAEKFFKTAIQIDDLFYPAKVNLAMLYNHQGKNVEAEKLLIEVNSAYPWLPGIDYTLGLLCAEMNRPEDAAEHLRKAARQMSDRPRVHYNLGLILQSIHQFAEAERALQSAVSIEPGNALFVYALTDFYIKQERFADARKTAELLKEIKGLGKEGIALLDFIAEQTRFHKNEEKIVRQDKF
jgi:tetratricopeptide (TPR) repeat protein